jgi:hypothetical protein
MPPRARFRLARGPHGPTASLPASPIGAFNALTFAGAQVKDESTPRRAWASRPVTVPPTPPVRPSPPLCDAVQHGQRQSRGTMPPTPVRPTRRTLERGQWSPRREDGRLLPARKGLRRDVGPAGPVTSVAIGPVRPSPLSQHHLGHCITISYTVGDGATRRRHAGCCAPCGLPSVAPSSQCMDDDQTGDPYTATLEAAPGCIQGPP